VKRILIIGATSTIASACARLWAAQGASLFLVGRVTEKLDALAGDLTVRGESASHPWQMDANDVSAHSPMLDAAVHALGSFDIALLAHGTLPDQAACEADAKLALREFQTNGTSAIALLTILAEQFESQRSGAIGVITSVAGDRGRPSNYVYGSAKAAVSTFCEGLRARLFKSGVSVTDIRPGFVATPMTRDLSLPGVLVAQPDAVGRRIVAGIGRGADILYVPGFWWWVMLVIRCIPRFLFKRMAL
jgi:short-subunit dehydrogenase